MNLTKKSSIQFALALSTSVFLAQNIITASAAPQVLSKASEATTPPQEQNNTSSGTEVVVASTPTDTANSSSARHLVKVRAKTYKQKKILASAQEGKLFYIKNNCATCHSAEGKGGCLAPPLDGIGSYHPKTYLIARITLGDKFAKRYEASHKNGELMPHPRIPFSESKVIADYLYSLPSLPAGYQMTSHGVEAHPQVPLAKTSKANQEESLKLDPKLVAAGRQAFAQAGCLACHSVDGAGGRFAPRLNGIANRRSLDYVRKMINRAELIPIPGEMQDEYAERGNIMPPAGLSTSDIESISQFLMSLK
jgi:mono/diheme cytochrome c family protein